MTKDILVLTATLGNRKSLKYAVESVKHIGKDRVHHVIITPESQLAKISSIYPDIECIAEPENCLGIYGALNYGFKKYGKDYKYFTFINDDDFWLDDFSKLINLACSEDYDVIYGKTRYVNINRIKIDSQACSSRLQDFIPLLKSGIVLMTQQAALIKNELFYKIGGFDESYKLVADTKLWALASMMNIKSKYINIEAAAYTINKGHQLSSDHDLQKSEHKRLLDEIGAHSRFGAALCFRLTNIPLYLSRILRFKGYIRKPATGRIKQAITAILPWPLQRYILNKYFLFDIAPTAHIGLSFIYPKFLRMAEGASIGHFNVAINLDSIEMGKNCIIGRSNWITGFPTGTDSRHFAHDKNRCSELIMGDESSITKSHHIDCTNTVSIGEFAAIGGYNTQILTHSVDMYECRQDSHPITIGKYSLVATRSIITGGAKLPNYSVLCAGAYLGKHYEQEWMMYGGVPAKPIKEIPKTAKRFSRTSGYIY
ncbi:MAG: glycosyltransferase [Bacteroidaceae bacterium]|nr:glycosyltransferase [Bacteroidaceae bacterium]